ncbi:glutathione S-transferase [Luteibacter sp. 621]
MRAPAALGELHPLGKAPLIIDAGLVLAESGAILAYLHDRNNGALRPAAGTPARAIHDELFEFVEGSGMPPLMSTLLGRLTDGFTPVMWSVVQRERAQALARVETALSANDYLCGARLMLADIQMAYLVAFADGLGLVDRHGGVLRRYLDRLHARDAYRRAVVIGGHPVGTMPARVPGELAG